MSEVFNVISVFSDGGKIEYNAMDRWVELHGKIAFNFHPEKYRIAPQEANDERTIML